MDYRKIAGAELNLLRFLGVLPETFEGLRVAAAGTPVYDLNGEELFRRIPLSRPRQETPAFVDIAAFYDAGSVARRARLLTRDMHTDYGLGVRVHSATHSLVRLDVARSVEGMRVSLSFSAPLGLPNKAIAPYVP